MPEPAVKVAGKARFHPRAHLSLLTESERKSR